MSPSNLVMHIMALPLLLVACSSTAQSDGSLPRSSLASGPPLSAPRATHAMVRSGDDLLLIGGCVQDGCEPGPQSATVDIIEVGRPATRKIGSLLAERVQPSAVPLPRGTVLVLGGWVDGRVVSSTEIFDPRTRRSRAGPTMSSPRSSPVTIGLSDGRVLIAGGFDGHRPLASAEIFDPAAGRLIPTGSLMQARSGATGTLLPNGQVLIAGGGTGDTVGRVALASAELFDPATGRFSATGSLAQRRYKHGAVALSGGDVVAIGGSTERDYTGKLDTVERYDWHRGRWAPAGRLAHARFKLADASVLLPSGKILVAGGYERPELFDPSTGRSQVLDVSLGGEWNYLTAALFGTSIFLAGGYSEGSIGVSDRNWLLSI